jgi:ABC-type sugar transport system ATPase subunit
MPLYINNREKRAVQGIVEKVNVVMRSAEAKMRTLSGGNQQKGILARWLLRDLEVLMFIEPTRGIDVGAKAEIYRYLDSLAAEGRGIIVVSPDLTGSWVDALVLHGAIVREFSRRDGEVLLANIQAITSSDKVQGAAITQQKQQALQKVPIAEVFSPGWMTGAPCWSP